MHVPTRERVAVGEAIRLEVGFGPLADEVVLDGTVRAIVPAEDGVDGGAPVVVVHIDERHADRLGYILEVLEGERQPVVRRFRRVRAKLIVRWSVRAQNEAPTRAHRTYTADVSAGGAFVVSRRSPPHATTLDVQLWLSPSEPAIELTAVVTWSGTAHEQPGFGIKFNHVDRETFARLQTFVAEHDVA